MDEHFEPDRGLSLEEYARRGDMRGSHHLARYLWLIEVISPETRTVLDLGCGAGYGSFLLAKSYPAMRVLGVDYDTSGIAWAQNEYRLPNLSFQIANAMTWEGADLAEPFDAIVSFDSLEHIPHREIVMEQVVLHLAAEGALYLSTPCGAPETELTPAFEPHRIEYGSASLFDFLSRYFRVIVRPEDPGFRGREVFERLNALGIDYLLKMNPVICREPICVSNPYRPR